MSEEKQEEQFKVVFTHDNVISLDGIVNVVRSVNGIEFERIDAVKAALDLYYYLVPKLAAGQKLYVGDHEGVLTEIWLGEFAPPGDEPPPYENEP